MTENTSAKSEEELDIWQEVLNGVRQIKRGEYGRKQEENTASMPHGAPAAQKKDALLEIVGMAEGEASDVARQHDKYLYGAE